MSIELAKSARSRMDFIMVDVMLSEYFERRSMLLFFGLDADSIMY